MMEAVDAVNEAQKDVLFQKIHRHFDGALEDKTIAIWGLAFKPRTDDIREAPALVLIDVAARRRRAAARSRPRGAGQRPRRSTATGSPTAIAPTVRSSRPTPWPIVTEWNEFRNPDFEVMRRLMRQPVIFDGRNVYDPARMAALGFTYHGIGRAPTFHG